MTYKLAVMAYCGIHFSRESKRLGKCIPHSHIPEEVGIWGIGNTFLIPVGEWIS